ncbi:MAG TPA: hypothetical protein VI670_14140 [Thermoanaerobaculia bacterium]|jgi:hypothetical protein
MYLFIIVIAGGLILVVWPQWYQHFMIRDHQRSWLRSELGEWRRSPEFVLIIRIAGIFFILVGLLSAWSLLTH